ncbi:receptor/non-receptor type protein-tyrosine phosphatase, partial [Martensiomyces pterosporus]
NYDLNRYCDVLPFNHNRVRLQGKSDYINASHILLPPSISPNKYVATQGPLNHSIADFWRMTWEQGSVCIVMLANPVEKSRNKCAVYWPQQVGRAMKAGDVTVTLVDERPLSACLAVVVRKLSLVHRSHAGEPRVVTQLHYTEWPDEGVPVSPVPILTMIKELRTTISPSPAVPVVIHCSAGVGRTGTFIVLDAATEYFSKNRDYPGDFTLDCVKSLRKQRTMTVQTFVQFMFCY